ncbi:DUF6148 family protein [Paracidovorax wautersii]|uniref:Uncharacterized protein n=1 Tax=Paracidovorax wautersii TaxID=1177982 RepID=A0A1I2GBL3_9BURK|nr:DUF6148 family protein [Paracidovorax wautersii]SFF14902.1 hypothetical protein SAMN04489711_11471 [Paracidovorax wautersii]
MSAACTANQLQQARARLQAYLAAEVRILESQEYVIGNGGTARRNRRADLESVQAGIKEVRAEIQRLESLAEPRVAYIRPY